MIGITSPWGSGKSYRLPNTAVHAYVKSGGLVWLEYESNEAHLKKEHIQNHVDFIESEAIPILENDEDAAQQVVLTRSVQIDKARKYLAQAKALLKKKVARSIASIRTLYNAHWNMRQAGRIVSTLSRNSGQWTQLKLAYAMERDEKELYPLN